MKIGYETRVLDREDGTDGASYGACDARTSRARTPKGLARAVEKLAEEELARSVKLYSGEKNRPSRVMDNIDQVSSWMLEAWAELGCSRYKYTYAARVDWRTGEVLDHELYVEERRCYLPRF